MQNTATIPQVVYDSGVRYIPKSISLSITVRYTDNLNLASKHVVHVALVMKLINLSCESLMFAK